MRDDSDFESEKFVVTPLKFMIITVIKSSLRYNSWIDYLIELNNNENNRVSAEF